LDRIVRAYPRERTIRMTIAEDVALEQLVDALVATIGGATPRFAAIGWVPDELRPAGNPSKTNDRMLELRAELATSRKAVRIDQPFPLAGDDQGRLQAFGQDLWRCVPELETAIAADRTIELQLVFEGGRVQRVSATKIAKLPSARLDALTRCVQDEAYALRLR